MPSWGWFVIGAGLGIAQLAWSVLRSPLAADHHAQGFAFAAVAGAAVYGTILWAIFA